jgi:hypothetical protein
MKARLPFGTGVKDAGRSGAENLGKVPPHIFPAVGDLNPAPTRLAVTCGATANPSPVLFSPSPSRFDLLWSIWLESLASSCNEPTTFHGAPFTRTLLATIG